MSYQDDEPLDTFLNEDEEGAKEDADSNDDVFLEPEPEEEESEEEEK
jgi:hypothetical protein